MTRIIAGLARGRRLSVPERGTRPTSDRVREAMFNAVSARMELNGARVLDLYAGSGALGLEALSRGAGEVLLVESDTRAAAVAKANAAVIGVPGATVRCASVASFVGEPSTVAFDLVLADPPYALGDDEVSRVLHAVVAGGWVLDGSLVVVERSARGAETTWPPELECDVARRYGEASVEIATCYRRRP